MKVRCPHCRIRGDVAASLGGRVVRCPRCLACFRVPFLRQPDEKSEPLQPGLIDPENRHDGRPPAGASGGAAAAPFPIGAATHKHVESLPEDDSGVSSEPESPDSQQTGGVPEPENGGDSHRMTPVSEAVDEPAAPERAALPADQDRVLVGGQRETTVAAADFPDLSEQNVAWEEASADHHGTALAGELSGVPDNRGATVDTEEKLQEELATLLSERCCICGKTMPEVSGAESGEPGRCVDCREDHDGAETKASPSLVGDHDISPVPASSAKKSPLPGLTPDGGFRAAAIVKAAWVMVAGVKGPIWGGVLVLLAVLVGLEAAATVLVPFATAFGGEALAVWLQIIVQLAGSVLFLTFLAGLYTIGVRRSCGSHYSWKTVFSGFPFIGRIGVAGFLMSLLIVSGFVLLILPGIYLAVGYSLTLPLMVAKQYGPWEAMEASRRLIHPRWWQVFGVYIVMYLIYVLSCIPLGIGLLWTIPMFFTLTGVLYRTLVPLERISQ